jgi:hypothetical protein
MKPTPTYVPILHWKKGEQEALEELSQEIKNNIIPLIEITPDFNEANLNRTLQCWNNRYFYFYVLPECYGNDEGVYFRILRQLNPNYVIPVLVLDDTLDIITQASNLSNTGIALRITPHDIQNLRNSLANILNLLDSDNIDLIFDLGYIENNNLSNQNNILESLFSSIPNINSFRNIIVSSSSFPESLSSIRRNTLEVIPRLEWRLFREYISNLESRFNIEIVYSDYCTSNPNYVDYKAFMKPSFNIRYTINEEYLILKGELWENGGADRRNISRLCNMLVSSGYFMGQDFSWGDNYIFTRSTNNATRYGNLTTWKKVGVNHHITFVVSQLELDNLI